MISGECSKVRIIKHEQVLIESLAVSSYSGRPLMCNGFFEKQRYLIVLFFLHLRAVLCKNQTKLEMKNFEPPTQIYMEVGPHEGCSKMSIIEVITQLLPW